MSVIESLYAYNNSKELTRAAISWANYPDPSVGKILKIGANSNLESEAVEALLSSVKIQSITSLQFTEIYVSAADFERLLTMPNLIELEISGGSSSDWNGVESIYSTLTDEHYLVLATSPPAKKLRRLTFDRESISDEMTAQIEKALPELESFNIF